MPHTPRCDREPTVADLAAIQAEWPVIEAELAVLDAEIALITTTHPSALDWRRLRRAEARLIRAAIDHTTTTHIAMTHGSGRGLAA
ncbi:MAG: hypothetical protein GXX79_21845 [Actinomycetales bacterium]|nr:hypothetical protein [Actinomycetales bacterium]